MSAKELLEGMCYVDDRFVDEAEHQTVQKKVIRPWMRLLPVAACLCILVVSAVSLWDYLPFHLGSTESMIEDNQLQQETVNFPGAAAGDPQSWVYQKQYIRTNGGDENRSYPFYKIIRSKEELNRYYEEHKDIYDLERRETVYADSSIGFLDACDQYDDAFFAQRDLIILVLEEGSGSVRHEIQGVRPYYDNSWQLIGRRIVPEVCTDDMAQWHILIEMDKNLIGVDETIVLEMTD